MEDKWTVKQLIEHLQTLPPSNYVLVHDQYITLREDIDSRSAAELIMQERKRQQQLAIGLWKGALAATSHEPNGWPWSWANAHSDRAFLKMYGDRKTRTRTQESKEGDNEAKWIGLSEQEIKGMVLVISNVKQEEEHAEGYETQTLSYDYQNGDERYEIVALRTLNCRSGQTQDHDVTVDGQKCQTYDEKCNKYTPLHRWPKCTLMAVLWLLDAISI